MKVSTYHFAGRAAGDTKMVYRVPMRACSCNPQKTKSISLNNTNANNS
jgi:hypothetical protein